MPGAVETYMPGAVPWQAQLIVIVCFVGKVDYNYHVVARAAILPTVVGQDFVGVVAVDEVE